MKWREVRVKNNVQSQSAALFSIYVEYYLTAGWWDAWQPVGIVGTHSIVIQSS
jgi:hypothetical protein